MDIQALKKHVVVHPSNASDPCASITLGNFISFGYSEESLYEDVRPEAIQVCLDAAQKIIEAPNDESCKCFNGEIVTAGEIKRDLMTLLEAENGAPIKTYR